MPDWINRDATLQGASLDNGMLTNKMYSFDTKSLDHILKVKQIEENRRIRHLKFPTLNGGYRYGYNTAQENVISNAKGRSNDEESQIRAPHRAYDNLIDPTSGFVSAGGEVDRNMGRTRIEPLVQLNRSPQYVTPQTNIIGLTQQAMPHELTRLGTWCPGAPMPWNSRKIPDVWIRAKLGGWTSDEDPRKDKESKNRPKTSPVTEQAKSERDKLALKYMYGTSTQRGYGDVPWDSMLRPKQWPPILAVDDKSDIVLYQKNAKRYSPPVQKLQTLHDKTDSYQPGKSIKERQANSSHIGIQMQQSPLYRPVPIDKPSDEYRRKSCMSKMVTLVPPYNPFNRVEKSPVYV